MPRISFFRCVSPARISRRRTASSYRRFWCSVSATTLGTGSRFPRGPPPHRSLGRRHMPQRLLRAHPPPSPARPPPCWCETPDSRSPSKSADRPRAPAPQSPDGPCDAVTIIARHAGYAATAPTRSMNCISRPPNKFPSAFESAGKMISLRSACDSNTVRESPLRSSFHSNPTQMPVRSYSGCHPDQREGLAVACRSSASVSTLYPHRHYNRVWTSSPRSTKSFSSIPPTPSPATASPWNTSHAATTKPPSPSSPPASQHNPDYVPAYQMSAQTLVKTRPRRRSAHPSARRHRRRQPHRQPARARRNGSHARRTRQPLTTGRSPRAAVPGPTAASDSPPRWPADCGTPNNRW